MIRVDPTPFAHIPRHPAGRERYHRIIRLIHAAEAALLRQLHEQNDRLARRLNRNF